MDFTPLDHPSTLWSDDVVLEVMPAGAAANNGESAFALHGEFAMYFKWNGLTNSAPLRVGMKLEDVIRILGEPTHHLRGEMLVEGNPKPPFDGWLRWYHNPREMHVAPWIRARIEGGIVKELKTGRG
jgi:hypothetical protein